MSRFTRFAGLLLGGSILAAPLAAQDRAVALQAMAGGYYHTRNLTSAPNGPDALHWNAGFDVGLGVGVFLNKYVGIHGDLNIGTHQLLQGTDITGGYFNKIYYGGHVEFQYPFSNGVAPYVFGGAGGVTVRQDTGKNTMDSFTRLAGMFGAGLSYRVPKTSVEVFGQTQGTTYKFTGFGLDRNQLDVSVTMGIGYRFGF